MSARVIILGGGVAGMSAAHELVERGFEVTVYERQAVPGGKARSTEVPGSGTDGRKDLPAEHGYHFFPRFYKHITDTMKRIPFGTNPNGVYDNIVPANRIEWARWDYPPVVITARFPRTFDDLKTIFRSLFSSDLGIPLDEIDFFAGKIWQILTSCKERRMDQYEKIGWWEFVDAEQKSEPYQKFLAYGLSRDLIAADPTRASAKTVGDILIQLLLGIVEPGSSTDRTLNGPLNDKWINPWLTYLQSRGVQFEFSAEVKAIHCDDQKVTGVTMEQHSNTIQVQGDFYIAALPVERFAPLISPEMLRIDGSLEGINNIKSNVAWMNGLQLYLKENLTLPSGHQIYVDSPWSVTSTSQKQSWPDVDLSQYGDGNVRGILSVIISDWFAEAPDGKKAIQCTREEIIEHVLAELKRSLNVGGQTIIQDSNLHSWFIDPDVSFEQAPGDNGPVPKSNAEPLFINDDNTWQWRPWPTTLVPNLFLASDYVRTNTDLATMEGANEAARRVVNTIIIASHADADPCMIWDLEQPFFLEPWRHHDKERYERGQPWDGRLLG